MTASHGEAPPSVASPVPLALLRAAHLGPTVAVTGLTAALALGRGLAPFDLVLVTGAVLCGQLTIGWANDLVDLRRDRAVGRHDKPLATAEVTVGTVRAALALAAVAAVALSLSVGWASAAVHLGLVVGSGQAYNLGLKATRWSWAPYAVAFGSLPAVVTLAADPAAWPAWWLVSAGATLGVGAHFLNVLPDLADDAATGVRGLPHRLGEDRSRVGATVLLVGASALALGGRDDGATAWTVSAAVLVLALAALSLRGRGRTPFRSAVGIAAIDVLLVVTGW